MLEDSREQQPAPPPESPVRQVAGERPRAAVDRRMAFADGLRGFAALWVVLYHLSEGHHVDALRALLPAPVKLLVFDWGHLGVGVFFVLSGFVMALTCERTAMTGAEAGRFVLRRLLRVAPPYYLAVAVSLGLSLAKGGHLDAGQLAAHALFLQGILEYDQINIVFWTLCVEIQFYLAFAALAWLSDRLATQHGGRGLPRLAVAALSLAWPLGLLTGPVWHGGFLPFWAYFMAGVVAWETHRGAPGRRLRDARFALAATFVVTLLLTGLARRDMLCSVAGLTSVALVGAGFGNGLQTWLSGRVLQLLGRVSYSLYLFHNPVTGPAFRLLGKSGGHGALFELVGALASVSCCLGVAWLSWYTVERASIAWSRSLSANRSARAADSVPDRRDAAEFGDFLSRKG